MNIEQQLGEFRFRVRKSLVRPFIWLSLLIYPIYISYNYIKVPNIITGNEIAIAICMLLFFIFFILISVTQRIDVYEKGLVYKKFIYKQNIIFNPYMQLYIQRWQWSIFSLFKMGKFTAFMLNDDGRQYLIPATFHRTEQIIVILENYLFKTSMHMLNQIYDAGEVLHFGGIQLSRQHISIGDNVLERIQISHVRIYNGMVKFYEKNKNGKAKLMASQSMKISNIANFRLFCRFIELNDIGMLKQAYCTKKFLIF